MHVLIVTLLHNTMWDVQLKAVLFSALFKMCENLLPYSSVWSCKFSNLGFQQYNANKHLHPYKC